MLLVISAYENVFKRNDENEHNIFYTEVLSNAYI